MLSPDVAALAAGPNYAHLATLMPDGSPHSSAVWVDVEGDLIVIYKEEGSLALENVRRDPRVAVSLVDFADPYRGFRVRGTVVAMREGAAAASWLEERAHDYTGLSYPPERTSGAGVLLLIEPERQSAYASPMRHRSGA
jgi:PPOX class probable F420-dependent enzyme